jgi:hypothetical protein
MKIKLNLIIKENNTRIMDLLGKAERQWGCE